MLEKGNQAQSAECLESQDPLRLLWEGTQKALAEWSMDPDDLVSLCEVIVRLADHRLLLIAKCGTPSGSDKVIGQIQHYRKLASDLGQWAAKPAPEPDWAAIEEKMKLVKANP